MQYQAVTPLEFYEALKDDNELRQYQVKVVADAIRMSTLWLVNIQLGRGKKVRNVKQLWEYPWDKEKKTQVQTEEQMKQVLKTIARDTKGNKKTGRRDRSSIGYSAYGHKRRRKNK